jgi:hypothetical protein
MARTARIASIAALLSQSASYLLEVRKVYFLDGSGKSMQKKGDFCRYVDN